MARRSDALQKHRQDLPDSIDDPIASGIEYLLVRAYIWLVVGQIAIQLYFGR